MKKVCIIFLAAMLALACNKNSLPTISRRSSEPSTPVPIANKDFVVNIDKGKIIFESHCNRCHGLHEPKEFTTDKWDKILSRMIPRARLSEENAAHVTAYIRGNSAK